MFYFILFIVSIKCAKFEELYTKYIIEFTMANSPIIVQMYTQRSSIGFRISMLLLV